MTVMCMLCGGASEETLEAYGYEPEDEEEEE
jgi:hypothetical protein